MPITDSAKKALRSSKRKFVYNLKRKRDFKDAIKDVVILADAGDAKGAEAKLPKAYQTLDKAVKTGLIKLNMASRKKSRLTKLVARASAGGKAVKK